MTSRGGMLIVASLLLVGSGGVSRAATYPSECYENNGKKISGYAKSCRDVCNDPIDLTFLSPLRLKACQKILVIAEIDRVDKGKLKKPRKNKTTALQGLEKCIKAAKNKKTIAVKIEQKVKLLKKMMRKEQDDDVKEGIAKTIKDLRSNFPKEPPKCVPSPQALKAIYKCLAAEAGSISKKYAILKKKGYGSEDIDVCSIKGIIDDSVESTRISLLFSNLKKNFDTAATCKRDVEGWNRKRAEIECGRNPTPECSNRIEKQIKRTNKILEPITKSASGVRRDLKSLESDAKNIGQLMRQAIVECD